MRAIPALLLCCGAVAAGAAEPARPNIVFILADDLGRNDCGFMGGTVIKTPHLDKLAAAGTVLDAFYVQPVCSPTRAALLTGRYPMRHGLQVGVVRPWAEHGLPLDERLLPQALKEAGYATAIVGKWHLGHVAPEYLPTRRGFDHQYGHYNGAIDYVTHVRDGGFDWHRDDRVSRDAGYSTHLIAREAVKVVEASAGKKPFFLYVPFNAVHAPHQVPDSYTAPYAGLTGNRKVYAGMLAAVDEAVGQIVAAVDKAGVRGNTLFVFSSDNGGPNPGTITDNGKYRAGKGTLYEGGVRVAAFATWDGHVPAGKTLTAPLHAIDLFPTLVHLCGAKAEQPLPVDGRDCWPTLTAGKPSPHEVILLNATPTGGAVRAADWKLVVNGQQPADTDAPTTPGAEKVELFDLSADPSETANLAAANPEKVAALRAKLAAFANQAVPPKSKPKPAGFVTPAVWGERPAKPTRVRLVTDRGDIVVELFADMAPATAANFLRYVDAGFYTGGRFHRTVTPANQPDNQVKIEVIQGGVNPDREKDQFPPVQLERTNATGLKHLNGTLSMARDGPDTATGDFFVCVGDQPELDFGGKRNPDGQGFAAFGRVVQGMDVVKKIQGSPADAQTLTPAVKIAKIERQ